MRSFSLHLQRSVWPLAQHTRRASILAPKTRPTSLPNDMRDHFDKSQQTGGFESTCVCGPDLIRSKRAGRAQQVLEEQLMNSLRSPQVEWTLEVRERMLAAVEDRVVKCPPR